MIIISDALDSLEERVKTFFIKCLQPNVKTEWREEQFQKIKQVSTIHNKL